MLALLYLATATYVGHVLCRIMLGGLAGSRLPPARRAVAPWVISCPAAFLAGTLLVTWATYIVAWCLRDVSAPLAAADAIVLGAALVTISFFALRKWNSRNTQTETSDEISGPNTTAPRAMWLDYAVSAAGLVVGSALMFHTCRLEGSTLVLGRTAFGDLNVHLGMARSFSYGKNFPTGYVAYAGTDIRYHFMFYFLVGNLEYLGLPLDWAINLPSILSFTAVLMLLHGLGGVVGRDRRVGALTVLFFLLRSSPAAFFYIAKLQPVGITAKLRALLETNRFIGLTQHESWGIWNLNVYVVERHFAFAFGLALIAILYLVRSAGLDAGPPLLRLFRREERTPASQHD